MKKIYLSMMAMAIAAFTFTACEDVPEPYNNPYNGNKGSEPEVVIEPAGSGTAEDPWNVAALLEKTAEAGLGDGEFLNSGNEVYVKGIVTETTEVSTQYGNATYYISDDAKGSNRFYVFRGKLLDGASVTAETDLEVGDEVTVCGKVKNYKGTMEFDQGNYLVSLKKGEGGGNTEKPEVKTVGTKDEPKSVTEALTAINAMADGATSEEFWFVKGKVVKVTTTAANFDQYKNLNYLISEDGTDNNTITVYAGNGLDNAQFSGVDALKVGDEVVVYGQLQKYVNKSGAMTPEIAKGNYLVKYTAAGGGSTPATGTGTLENPLTASQAYDAVAAMTADAVSDADYYVKGKVCSIKYTFSAQYGTATFNISDDGTETSKQFIAYSCYYFDNKPWAEGNTQIQVGDEVIVCGKVINYKGDTPEFSSKKNWLVSLNGKTSEGGNDNPATGTGTLENPLTASQAYDAVAAMTADAISDADYYVKGKVSSIKYTFSAQYGTATFNISDDGTESSKQFIAYSCYYFDNKPWAEGNTQIQVGDEVIVCGKVINYKGDTPEFANKKNWLVSLNGKTSEGGNDNQGGGNSSATTSTITMADFGLANQADLTTLTASDGTKLTFSQEGGSNAPKYYTSGNAARMYALNSLSITASKAMTKVVLICAMNGANPANGNDTMYGEAGGSKVTTKKDSDTQVTFSNFNNSTLKIVNDHTAASSGTQLRIVSIEITYAQ